LSDPAGACVLKCKVDKPIRKDDGSCRAWECYDNDDLLYVTTEESDWLNEYITKEGS